VGTLWSAVAIVEIRTPYAPACQSQPFEGLRRCHLVDEVQVDVEQIGLSGAVAG